MTASVRVISAIAFILLAAAWGSLFVPAGPLQWLIIAAAGAAGYMAINIGANDVANNVGPAVGARAMTMTTALLVAAVFDALGAFIAGGDVIATVSEQLLRMEADSSDITIVLTMISALLAAALWVNFSTLLAVPISTTHAIIGGMVGAAIAAGGLDALAWPTIGAIAVTWVLSPFVGGLLAAGLHATIRKLITRRADKIAAARIWVPVLIAAMAGLFTAYIAMVVWNPRAWVTIPLAVCGAAIAWLVAMPWVRVRSLVLENRKKQVALLFRPALVVAAALLSFAHGSNDVANAIGPFIAILSVLQAGEPGYIATTPLWTLAIGALGLSTGILLFGPRVVHTIGEQITKLNEIRAFCVALASTITVLAASAFGIPLSSTHVAVGAVFGVGFLREYLAMRNMSGAAVPIRSRFIDPAALNDTPQQALARERRYERRYLVSRLRLARIGVAWLITLPAAALLSALVYALLHHFVVVAGGV